MSRRIDARVDEMPQHIEADICIVGGGAAGVTIASNLNGKNIKIVLLESGSSEMEGQTQQLYSMKQTGLQYFDMTTCRLRYFGGTTNHWGGYCRENDRIDYRGRPEKGVPKWPVGYDEIKPYVNRAAAFLGLDLDAFDPSVMARKFNLDDSQIIDKSNPVFETKLFQISRKLKIHELYSDELAENDSLDLVFNANVTNIRMSDDGRYVRRIEARAIGRPHFNVTAKIFVLAAHAVENARLLLASDDVISGGIGNENGHVGRYFMEHPQVVSGVMVPTKKFPQLYNYEWARRNNINANLSFTSDVMQREGMLQYYCRFDPVYGYEHISTSATYLKNEFWSPGDIDALAALGAVFGDIPNSFRYARSRVTGSPASPLAFKLDHRIEQAPNYNSYIKLSNEVDAVGVRKAVLNWELNDTDYHTFARGQEVLIREFEKDGLAKFQAPELTPELINRSVKGHYHHIGTTRMSDDARTGVVDRHCRVHGVDNLYVAGSAIFPTAGYSGPTMMIIAFSMRLAEHIGETVMS